MRHRNKLDTAICQVAKHVRQAAEKAEEDYEPIESVDLFSEVKKIGGIVGFKELEDAGNEGDNVNKTKEN